jgi:hypothetical protein
VYTTVALASTVMSYTGLLSRHYVDPAYVLIRDLSWILLEAPLWDPIGIHGYWQSWVPFRPKGFGVKCKTLGRVLWIPV